jgi:hypothetical protein
MAAQRNPTSSVSTVAQAEPLRVAHREPVRRRDRTPSMQLVPFLSVAAASTAGRELLLGVLGPEALPRDLDEE